MADDSEDDPRTKRKLWPVLIALPVIYVLSIGPAVVWLEWLEDHASPKTFEVASNVVEVVYAPLIWTEESMPPVYRLLEWYMRLFH